MSADKFDALVAKYRKVREMKKEIEERHKAELAPYNEALKGAEQHLLHMLQDKGIESAKTEAGTVYVTTKHTASCKDFEALLQFCKDRDDFSVLSRSVSHVAVRELLEEGIDVPGVDLKSFVTVGVRKG